LPIRSDILGTPSSRGRHVNGDHRKVDGWKQMSEQVGEEQRNAMLRRLARLEGQIRGIQAMIRRGDDCEAIAQQFSASRKALDRAYQQLLVCLVEEAVMNPNQAPDETMSQVRAIFTKYS
jgi:DNA-binding FrmR family transcriptional regulator